MSDETNEVTVRVAHQRGVPAINIKVWPPTNLAMLLPLPLGQVKEAGAEEYTSVVTAPEFTAEWIEAVPDDTREFWWQQACEDGFAQAKELATETFGPHVQVWQEGRSGGWLTVEGLGDPREWEEERRAAWLPFAAAVRAMVDDTAYRWLWNLNANVFEPEHEADEAEAGYMQDLLTLIDSFNYERCSECEGDLSAHMIGPDPLGKPHLWCRRGEG